MVGIAREDGSMISLLDPKDLRSSRGEFVSHQRKEHKIAGVPAPTNERKVLREPEEAILERMKGNLLEWAQDQVDKKRADKVTGKAWKIAWSEERAQMGSAILGPTEQIEENLRNVLGNDYWQQRELVEAAKNMIGFLRNRLNYKRADDAAQQGMVRPEDSQEAMDLRGLFGKQAMDVVKRMRESVRMSEPWNLQAEAIKMRDEMNAYLFESRSGGGKDMARLSKALFEPNKALMQYRTAAVQWGYEHESTEAKKIHQNLPNAELYDEDTDNPRARFSRSQYSAMRGYLESDQDYDTTVAAEISLVVNDVIEFHKTGEGLFKRNLTSENIYQIELTDAAKNSPQVEMFQFVADVLSRIDWWCIGKGREMVHSVNDHFRERNVAYSEEMPMIYGGLGVKKAMDVINADPALAPVRK